MGASFDEVFAAEFQPLYRYLRRRVGADAAEELAEAAFATAFANWDRLDAERPVRPWLYGIAANLLRHHWRRERRMLAAYARTGIDPVAPEDDRGDERADAAGAFRSLAALLADLRREDRELLLLHAWGELTDAEIAAALDLPIGTVKSRLHRLRGRLRNRIDGDGQVRAEAAIATTEEKR